MDSESSFKIDIVADTFVSGVAGGNSPATLIRRLDDEGYRIINFSKLISLYISEFPKNNVSSFGFGTWIADSMLYIPGEAPRFLKQSPLLDAVCNGEYDPNSGNEYAVRDEDLGRLRKTSLSFRNGYDGSGRLIVPARESGSHPFMVFAFGNELAMKNGSSLEHNGITSFGFHFLSDEQVRSKNEPFIRQIYVGGLYTCPKSYPLGNLCVDASSGFVRTKAQHIDRIRGVRPIESFF